MDFEPVVDEVICAAALAAPRCSPMKNRAMSRSTAMRPHATPMSAFCDVASGARGGRAADREPATGGVWTALSTPTSSYSWNW